MTLELSFGIITNGARPQKLLREVASIQRQRIPAVEILVTGDVDAELLHALEARGVRFLPEREAAATGNLGKMRNTLVANARFGTVVVSDDDMVFRRGFYSAVAKVGDDFDALAVRILNPDGTRYWDYATKGGPRGHMLLKYGTPDDHTYVTGGLIVLKRHVFERVRWADDRGFYENEDVDFSERLRNAGFTIGFCRRAVVRHDDWRYTSDKDRHLKVRSEEEIAKAKWLSWLMLRPLWR